LSRVLRFHAPQLAMVSGNGTLSLVSEDLVLGCLTWLPGASGHLIIATCCRGFCAAAASDDLWIARLGHDFPRVRLQGKSPGSFLVTYKILTKAYRQRVGPSKGTQEPSQSPWRRLLAARPEPSLPGPSRLYLQHACGSLPELFVCARAAAAAGRRRGQRQPIEVTERVLQQLIADRRGESQAAAAALEAGGGVTRAVAVFEAAYGTFASGRQSQAPL